MKRSTSFVLCTLLLLPLLASCSAGLKEPMTRETKQEETQIKEESKQKETKEDVDTYEYQEIKDKLSWDKINSFPIAPGSDMTIQELRQLCADFFRFSKSALWIPDNDFSYERNSKGTMDKMLKGEIYGGLPYIGLASCSIYRLMDWYNEETGVVDMEEATKFPQFFGNQCSLASHWGWARVINSAKHTATQKMTVVNGFLRVGPYTYDLTKESFSSTDPTTDVCADNGEQTMFESYAQMKLADGLVYYTTAGHVIMCTGEPVVKRNTDGSINGDESYMLITDQGQVWTEQTNEAGDTYQMKSGVDTKKSFSELFKSSYIPFTFAEFLGTDPCEETVCTIDYQGGDSITIEDLKKATVTTNYAISDLYAYIKDENGEIVDYKVERAEIGSVRSATLSSAVYATSLKKYCDGKHTVDVVCQLGTGERLTVYSGILTE